MDYIHSDKHYVVIGKTDSWGWQIAAPFGGGSSPANLLTKEQAVKLRDELRGAYKKARLFYVCQLVPFIDEAG